VARFATQLCPPPWRVPSLQDFVELDLNLGGDGANRSVSPSNIYCPAAGDATTPQFGGTWGGARWTANSSNLPNASSRYWASTESNATDAHYLYYGASNISPQITIAKDLGFTIRCVRNP
jgi:uncharacterized protein (TIGR02145 family)